MTAKRMGLVGLCVAAVLAASLVFLAPTLRTYFFKPGADAPPPAASARTPLPEAKPVVPTLEEARSKMAADMQSALQKPERTNDKTWFSPAPIGPDAQYIKIIREGGPEWTASIENEIRKVMEQPPREFELRRPGAYPLKLLTVLRRLQGSPDPLTVIVDKPPPIYVMPDMPGFCVRLVNTDVKQLPIYVLLGGDYRSGRRTKFSLEVTDPDGRILSILPDWWSVRGGILHPTVLATGESVVGNSGMHLTSYVSIPKPGKYTIRVLFSEHHIADLRGTDGVILYRSDPFVIDFQTPPTRRSREVDDTVRSLLTQLPEEGPILFPEGIYDAQAYEIIPPDTPLGRILTLGWQAVPVMVDELGSPSITAGRLAWLEGLLFSMTGCNDPRNRSEWEFQPQRGLICKFWFTNPHPTSQMYKCPMFSDGVLKAIAARWAEWKPLLNAAPAPP